MKHFLSTDSRGFLCWYECRWFRAHAKNACNQVKLLKRHSLSNRARQALIRASTSHLFLETGKKMQATQNRSLKPRLIRAKGKIHKYLGMHFVAYQWGVFQVGFRCRVFFRLVVHDLIPIWHKVWVRMRCLSREPLIHHEHGDWYLLAFSD